MAKLNSKNFGRALKIIRASGKDSKGKLKDRDLAKMCGQMLKNLRTQHYDTSNEFATRIINRGIRK